MPRRSPTSPTCGPSRVTCRRAIRTGNWSLPKPGNDRMAAPHSRFAATFGVGLCLIAGLSAPAQASGSLKHRNANAQVKLRNAQVETLKFAALAGWTDDDHAVAFDAFLKSCSAILQGSKAMRAARPLYGVLFKVCERAARIALLPCRIALQLFRKASKATAWS